ncbi:homeobox protein Nanog [Sarotherodon galilaeus]
MDNQEQGIPDPFLALEIELARLNENADHSQNTPPQNHEHPEVINNNNNDPLELIDLALAQLARSESSPRNNTQDSGFEHVEAHSQQNLASSDPFAALNSALEALAQIQHEVQIPPELLSQINRLNQNIFNDSQHLLSSTPRCESVNRSPPLPLINGFNESNQQQSSEIVSVNPMNNAPDHPFQQGGNPDQSCASNSPQPSIVVRNKFNNVQIREILNFPPPNDIPDYAHYYQGVMGGAREISDRIFSQARPDDLIQLELIGPQLQNNVSVILRDNRDLSEFENLFLRAVQSNWSVMCEGSLELVAQIVRPPSGSGKRMLKHILHNEIVRKKRRFLYIVHNPANKLCFAISLAHLLHPDFNDQQAEVFGREIQQKAGLNDQTPVGFNQIITFERLLGCKIIVFYRNENDRSLCKFETSTPNTEKTLCLFLFENHYYAIKNLKGFMGTSYLCNHCYIGYNHVLSHFCRARCSVCMHPDCNQYSISPIVCHDCNRTCRSPYCFKSHKKLVDRRERSASNCQLYKKCVKCSRLYYLAVNEKPHKCQNRKCPICRQEISTDQQTHQCYMQVLERETKHNNKLIFYDFETFVNQTGEHTPFLVCTRTLDGKSWNCVGEDCAEKFLAHFRRPLFKGCIFIAHNAKGFDGYLILSRMAKQGLKPHLIMQGSKVISFTDPDFNQRYMDSSCFLPMPLSGIPKAMGFSDSVKGFFPHSFSSRETLKYVGPYPPPSAYSIERMTTKSRDDFYKWYDSVSSGTFNFMKEAMSYCENDVEILAEGCKLFRNGFIEETGVDPFSRNTLASACLKTFLTNFMPANSLAIPCPLNYRNQVKSFSSASIQWLEYLSYTQGVFIRHALNQGEKKLGAYYLDGYALINDKPCVWEFLGCYFHGCVKCFSNQADINPLLDLTFAELNSRTEEKLVKLRTEHNVCLVTIWEHEWTELKRTDVSVINFLKHYEPPEPLNPRDALFGGRTSPAQLRCSAGPGERIGYVDVTSLYPFVNSTCSYPLGHPQIIFRNFQHPKNYFGFIKAVVYPPRALYFPVLPYKTKSGKLLFTLCRTCAEMNNQQGACNHSNEERALKGVWTTVEFNLALEKGYQISRITEVWHFEKQSNTIFTDYVHHFLRKKQEASGYPSDVVTEEDKQLYIKDYQAKQGITLDPENIKLNPAKRQMAKLCLNSFWGKFGQRNNLTQSKLVSDPEEFFNLMFSPKYKVTYFSFVSDDVALIQWCYGDLCTPLPNSTDNIFIAAFTTSYGRMKLYSYLDQLQERAIYYDTDSVVYLTKQNQSELELGRYLGDLTNELEQDDFITEFVAAGPKSYGYMTKKGKVVLKAKGITQTHDVCERVNFESVKNLVDNYIDNSEGGPTLEAPQHTILRNKTGFALKNSSFPKKFRVVYDKRRLLPGGLTLPFGY